MNILGVFCQKGKFTILESTGTQNDRYFDTHHEGKTNFHLY
jgi:hypothetical protein